MDYLQKVIDEYSIEYPNIRLEVGMNNRMVSVQFNYRIPNQVIDLYKLESWLHDRYTICFYDVDVDIIIIHKLKFIFKGKAVIKKMYCKSIYPLDPTCYHIKKMYKKSTSNSIIYGYLSLKPDRLNRCEYINAYLISIGI